MENREKQITEEPKDPKKVENLTEAELDKVAGGAINYNSSKSNVSAAALNKSTPKLMN